MDPCKGRVESFLSHVKNVPSGLRDTICLLALLELSNKRTPILEELPQMKGNGLQSPRVQKLWSHITKCKQKDCKVESCASARYVIINTLQKIRKNRRSKQLREDDRAEEQECKKSKLEL